MACSAPMLKAGSGMCRLLLSVCSHRGITHVLGTDTRTCMQLMHALACNHRLRPFFFLQDFKEMFVQYRSRLSSIVRHAAAVLPEQALGAAQRRLDAAVAACSPGSGGCMGVLTVHVARGLPNCCARAAVATATEAARKGGASGCPIWPSHHRSPPSAMLLCRHQGGGCAQLARVGGAL